MTADTMALAAQERAELADFLAGLTPQQWRTPSLCTGWTVHDVVAHVVSYEEHGRGEVFRRLVRARLRPGQLNDVGKAEYATLESAELVEFLRAHLRPRGMTASLGGGVGLVDALIHHQDIRRPLGMPRTIPSERLLPALRIAITAPPLRGFWNARGVRLVATDLEWTRGSGPEAHGEAEALLMALAGRAGVARELTGPGASTLVRRLG
ncbi:maleylpyruvate isomerase family mycothiol-dependent enzyme [Allosaccharopolyspora coralli]|uniref:maleylpyruvate isomerase family mycothiol-dependent enzyme n=1 Tax=Allosaccharopolyspora coralli TaxID=2665642 RepID=UPI002B4082AE|nr:maleylpyruvate isomerase family mycothiol-dependent enzyme [Allosaccharopolyspora coralli]